MKCVDVKQLTKDENTCFIFIQHALVKHNRNKQITQITHVQL